ncbi:MAG: prephenate dehydratase [Cellulosilyticaceae bacterium]
MDEVQYQKIENKLRLSLDKIYEATDILGTIEEGFKRPLDMTKSYNVGFQGVPGSFSEAATLGFFKGIDYTYRCYTTFEQVLQAVSQGEVAYGVLPIENSFTGEVLEVYDLLNAYNLHVIGEQVVKVEHSLLGIKGASIDTVTQVYSHPQALSQCNQFLSEHEAFKSVPYHNTAMATQYVAQAKDAHKAAIGSKRAAHLYGLDILEEDIANTKDNYTRFIVIGKYIQIDEKCDKVSIVFTTKHESGALYSVLSHFAYNGVNLLKIHSRPRRNKSWHYIFFVDLEGNLEDANMLIALGKVNKECEYFRILGNYTQCKEDEIGGICND